MNPVSAVGRFIFAAEDARRLAALRIGLFGLLALRLATNGDYAAVAGQPSQLFDPVSLFHLLPSMPSPAVTTVAQVTGVLAAVLAAAGIAPRASFPAAFAVSVFLNLMLNATGKIVHNDLVATLCLIPLLATPTAAARAWAIPIRKRLPPGPPSAAYGWPVRLAMIIVGLAYLFVGLQKLRYSGLDWATTDNLRFVLWASSDAQAGGNWLALFIANNGWIAHVFAASTMVVEIGFILCLPFRRLRWILVPSVVGMHLGIWAAMGLDYLPQAAAVIIVFVNWPTVIAFLRQRSSARHPAEEPATP